MDFKLLLQELREEAGISVNKLAKLSGIPESTIRTYEQGRLVPLDKADKLLAALGAQMTIGRKDEDI